MKMSMYILCFCLFSNFIPNVSVAAEFLIDDFNFGDIMVSDTTTSSPPIHISNVWGEHRSIALIKADESSETSISVNSGVLTWNQTSFDYSPPDYKTDYAWVGYGTYDTSIDLSSYNAFQITVLSAPADTGQLEVNFYYYGSPTHTYGTYATVDLPTSGNVVIPFSTLISVPSFPAIDLTQAHCVSLTFRGNLLAPGTYVLDDFKLVSIPEPATFSLLAIGSILSGRKRRK